MIWFLLFVSSFFSYFFICTIYNWVDRSRNENEKEKALSELSNINSQLNYSRVRRSDIDDAKRQAERFAEQRNELNNDPRRKEIPRHIRQCEEKIDKLKREIEDDNIAIKELRRCVEEQNVSTQGNPTFVKVSCTLFVLSFSQTYW